ncbi:MAG: sigma-70 family RNA polymerase sigma factor [Acidobacteria bacterium]|nr:sigma-70 family RNA polymerase sigma factor [Acidobacteriota bacterium]
MREEEFQRFRQIHATLIRRLSRDASASRWGLSEEAFARSLYTSARHRFGDAPADTAALTTFLGSLHLEDLALACACGEGRDTAWEHFITTYRHDMRRAGRAIAGDAAGAELADSLYAELYGLDEQDGKRRSLFSYFHGRSKLSTWLHAVLAQRHIDAVRSQRRTESIDEAEAAGRLGDRMASPEPDPDRTRLAALLQKALTSALASLDAGQRLRLAYYYVQQLTLAQIGKLTGEHEATVSRKLDRARRDLRARVDRTLREDCRLTSAEVACSLEYATDQGSLDLSVLLADRAMPAPGAPERKPDDVPGSTVVQDPGRPAFQVRRE